MTKKNTKVLIVDDNEDILIAAKLLLKPYASVIETEKNPNQLPELLSKNSYDVIFLDMNFTQDMTSGKEGFYWLNQILKIDPTIIVIMITAYGDVEMAVKAVKEGATDFILKPWQNEKLVATFSAALKLRESKLEVNNLRSQQKYLSDDLDKKFQELIGVSEQMKEVFRTIDKVAKTDANVLILGENGTGKELVGRALHRQSSRADKVFINVDMGALTPTLFESELFGHVKGAFTDAKEERVGRFEAASGGTLFLDEIGNIPFELQAKLLNVIQSRNVARVGSNNYRPIDIRLICATNHPIYDMVKEGKFRQDLLYRINTVEIRIPPLRERKEDIQLLSGYFLEIFKKKYDKPDLFLPILTMKRLENYHWPGNVRELQHAIERSAIMCETNELQPSDFFFTTASDKDETFAISNYNLENVEKEVIMKVLREQNGNITQAAKELGLTRTSLYRRMEKYGL
jgi:two-component system response regulator HydG